MTKLSRTPMSRFKPGDLAWIACRRIMGKHQPIRAGARGYDLSQHESIQGNACTIVRQAIVKDFGQWWRRTTYEKGVTYAGRFVIDCWLVLTNNELWIVQDVRLNKRLYKKRGGDKL